MRILRSIFLLILASSFAHADGPNLVGKAPPPIAVESWNHAPDASRGRVILLVYSPPAVELLNDLVVSYASRGLRVLVLAKADPPDGVLFHAGRIAVADQPAGALLVGADDKVAWQGDRPDRARIEKLLKKVKLFAIREVSEEARPAAQAYAKGQLAKAEALAGELPDSDDSKFVLGRIEAQRSYWSRQEQLGTKAGAYELALDALERLKKHFKDEAAAARAKELKSDPAVRNALRAAAELEKLWSERVRAGKKEKALRGLAKKVAKLRDKYDGTLAAKRAKLLLDDVYFDPAIDAIRAFIAKERIQTAVSGWRTDLPRPPKLEFNADADYFWLIETNQGSIRARFFPDVAPMHVSSTIYLTVLGFYDGLSFHRVITNFMAQGGCPLGSGSGNPGYLYEGEFDEKVRHDRAGLLSMANSGPDTDGSQFFITFKAARSLDDLHTIFGEVVEGMETVKKLEALGSKEGKPREPLTIERARVEVRLRD